MKTLRTLRIIVWVGTVILFLLLLWGGWAKYLNLRIRVALAEEQVRYFEEAVQTAKQQGSKDGIGSFIEAVTNYYPSGTKQTAGSHLDLIVERARSNAVEVLRQREQVSP